MHHTMHVLDAPAQKRPKHPNLPVYSPLAMRYTSKGCKHYSPSLFLDSNGNTEWNPPTSKTHNSSHYVRNGCALRFGLVVFVRHHQASRDDDVVNLPVLLILVRRVFL